jgi:hypothetical protein
LMSVVILAVVIGVTGIYFGFSEKREWRESGMFCGKQNFGFEKQAAWNKYDGAAYSMQYPSIYEVVPANVDYKVFTMFKKGLTADPGSKVMEIHKYRDFEGGDRPIGIEESVPAEEMTTIVPAETLTLKNDTDTFEVRLFYAKNDVQTKNSLHEIYRTLQLK